MTRAPAVRVLETTDDAATELTLTDIAASLAVVREVSDDDVTQATAPVTHSPRMAKAKVTSLRRERSAIPDPAELDTRSNMAGAPVPDLELLVLQQDNLRLQRELEATRREVSDLQKALDGARRASRDANEQAEMWKRVAKETEGVIGRVARERDHYKQFAHSGILRRLQGCEAFDPERPEGARDLTSNRNNSPLQS